MESEQQLFQSPGRSGEETGGGSREEIKLNVSGKSLRKCAHLFTAVDAKHTLGHTSPRIHHPSTSYHSQKASQHSPPAAALFPNPIHSLRRRWRLCAASVAKAGGGLPSLLARVHCEPGNLPPASYPPPTYACPGNNPVGLRLLPCGFLPPRSAELIFPLSFHSKL